MVINTCSYPIKYNYEFQNISISDAESLGELMDQAYQGTIDHDGETLEQCVSEITGTIQGKYGPFLDFASFLIKEQHQPVSAALVTLWKDQPLLAFSMTRSSRQGKGYARFLIERSINALAERGYLQLYLAVTNGNAPAEHLYRKIGFKVAPSL